MAYRCESHRIVWSPLEFTWSVKNTWANWFRVHKTGSGVATLRKQMSRIRWVSLAALGLLAVVSIFALSIFIWEDRCDEPSDEAQRVLVPLVKLIETQDLAASGRVGDI